MKTDLYIRAGNADEVERQRRTFLRMRHSHNHFFSMVERSVKMSGAKSVLEMACGCGLMANEAHLRWKCTAAGWDNNQSYLDTAAALFPELHFKKIGFMEKAPKTDKFDLIIFREALMECVNPHKVIGWSSKLLKKNGWISALEPDYGATIMYPEIPLWNTFLARYRHYCKKRGEDFFMGRALLDNFLKAGLKKVTLQPIFETHSNLDRKKFRDFVEIEAFSIEADMPYFTKTIGMPVRQVKEVINALRRLPDCNGAYLQTLMIAICGQV